MPEYNIKVQFEQKTFSFLCSEDQDIISAAKMNGIDLPSSCCSGVCTDCASMILEGSVDQEDAMGLNDDLREKGFALLCVAYPKSDLNIIIGIDLPSSCCSGVCTDCASMILEGSVDQDDAMGLNDDLREKGFALLCVAYPKSCLLYTSPSPRDLMRSRMPSSA